ncbi:MAG: metallophosphoesterase [Porphyromonadaceae bacterium]|nr:MAG: metallophosphoesterase [Porphyromonadaceae bacterium]
MIRIGVLSDTHGQIDQPVLDFFKDCDEIWHAGDLGDTRVMDVLAEGRVFRGVYGNIDGWEVRRELPEFLEFTVEEVKVMITHIGFYSGHYLNEVVKRLNQFKPKLFICGHSHILKIKNDPGRQMLHINPGAAGHYGIHQVRTAVRFEINGDRIENFDLWETNRNVVTALH